MVTTAKKKILVVAPHLPRFDKNSGDLRLLGMLKLLVEVSAVDFIYHDISNGDNKYILVLSQIGVTSYSRFSFYNRLIFVQYSFVILEFYSLAEHYIPRIRCYSPGSIIVVDTVDAHFVRLFNKYGLTGDEDDLTEAVNTKNRETWVYNNSDLLLAVTEDDKRSISTISSTPTIIIPNIHELPELINSTKKYDLIFVGGFNHEPNVDAVNYLLLELLPFFHKKNNFPRIAIVGNNPPAEILNHRSELIDVTGYVDEITPYLLASRVSVAPLRYGAGMKGKVGQAMAHGIPVVTTTVGSQGMRVEHGRDVLIADNPEEFFNAVNLLLGCRDTYDRIRHAALKYIAENLTHQKVKSQIQELFATAEVTVPKRISMDIRIKAVCTTTFEVYTTCKSKLKRLTC